MALNYTIQEKGNPQDPEGIKKYYIVSTSLSPIEFDDLIDEAAEETTLNPDELRLGVNRFFKKAIDRMFEGHTVHLTKIGRMGVRVHSKGSDREDEVTVAGNVTDIKPYFIFSDEIRARLKKIKLKKKE